MTVYVVTSGEYSDYGINAMFSTKEKAEEYVQLMNAWRKTGPFPGYRIEEWPLDAPLNNFVVSGRYNTKNNTLSCVYLNENNSGFFPFEHWNVLCSNEPDCFSFALHYNKRLDDVSVLLKAVQDKYAQYKYEKEITDENC